MYVCKPAPSLQHSLNWRALLHCSRARHLPLAASPVQGASARHASVADLVLEGHEDNAEFALGVSSTQQPRVASGGKDNLVSHPIQSV